MVESMPGGIRTNLQRYVTDEELERLRAAAAGGPGQSNAAKAGQPLPKPGTPPPVSIYNHALTVGFSRAFEVAAPVRVAADRLRAGATDATRTQTPRVGSCSRIA